MAQSAEEAAADLEASRAAWEEIAAGYDAVVTPSHAALSEEGLRRANLSKGDRFLDVAAGSGALSIPAARQGARVLATDLAPAMLARLEERARAEGLSIETRVMDGHALELEDETFDVTGSQFGVMLFPQMPRGIREMARVTQRGGRVLVIAFGPPEKVEFFGFFLAAIHSVIPEFLGPASPPLPFQLQDPQKFRQVLAEAGLKDVRVESATEELTFESGDELWRWLTSSNPIVEMTLRGLNLAAEQRERARRELDRALRRRSGGDGPATLRSLVHIGVGTK